MEVELHRPSGEKNKAVSRASSVPIKEIVPAPKDDALEYFANLRRQAAEREAQQRGAKRTLPSVGVAPELEGSEPPTPISDTVVTEVPEIIHTAVADVQTSVAQQSKPIVDEKNSAVQRETSTVDLTLNSPQILYTRELALRVLIRPKCDSDVGMLSDSAIVYASGDTLTFAELESLGIDLMPVRKVVTRDFKKMKDPYKNKEETYYVSEEEVPPADWKDLKEEGYVRAVVPENAEITADALFCERSSDDLSDVYRALGRISEVDNRYTAVARLHERTIAVSQEEQPEAFDRAARLELYCFSEFFRKRPQFQDIIEKFAHIVSTTQACPTLSYCSGVDECVNQLPDQVFERVIDIVLGDLNFTREEISLVITNLDAESVRKRMHQLLDRAMFPSESPEDVLFSYLESLANSLVRDLHSLLTLFHQEYFHWYEADSYLAFSRERERVSMIDYKRMQSAIDRNFHTLNKLCLKEKSLFLATPELLRNARILFEKAKADLSLKTPYCVGPINTPERILDLLSVGVKSFKDVPPVPENFFSTYHPRVIAEILGIEVENYVPRPSSESNDDLETHTTLLGRIWRFLTT